MTAPRFSGLLGLALLCLAALPAWNLPARAEETPAVRIEACGAMPPQTGDELAPRPVRLARPDGPLVPGDAGLGCRFVVTGDPKGKPVVVEARLSRPALVGPGQALDRWFVLARQGEPAVAEHVFAGPAEVRPGQWTLELLLEGRLVAERHFEIAAAEPPAPSAQGLAETTPPQPAPAPKPATGPTPPVAAARPERPPLLPTPRPAAVAPRPQPERPPAKPAAGASRPTRATGQTAPAKLPAAPRPGQTPPPQAASGYFALQTGVFAEPGNAAGQAARLRGQGFPACVAVETGPGGKRYRVLAGRFGDRRTAMNFRAEVGAASGGKAVPQAVDPATAARLRCQ
jgi:cell division septation protein DedD